MAGELAPQSDITASLDPKFPPFVPAMPRPREPVALAPWRGKIRPRRPPP
jgi:hypothetical protein